MNPPNPRPPRRSSRAGEGFTLVELIVVVIILAIAAAVVVPYAVGTGQMSCQAAARRLMADLEYAQNQAIVTQTQIKVTFDSSTNSYTVANQSGPLIHPITKKDYVVDFDIEDTFKGIAIGSAVFGGAGEVNFSALGAPDQGGSVDLAAGAHTYRVTVAPVTGRVSVVKVP
ncbi:MAG TPA: GspH/FimT family protein [Phycisphaerae bacterium]|nr:GspH/FimT family protein [Phycisphaerae bacterium]